MSCRRVRGWGDAAFPQWQLWAMHMGQSHMFQKGLESWVQMQLKMVSMCVLSHCLGFLDNHSCTGKLPLQPNFCWSVSELQVPSGTETTSQEAMPMNTAEQAATPSSLLTRDWSRVMEGYKPWAILDHTANCKLFPLLRKKSESSKWPLLLAVFHTSWPFLLSSSKTKKLKPRLATGRSPERVKW